MRVTSHTKGLPEHAYDAECSCGEHHSHVRVQLARYRVYKMCPDCQGTRFRPESLLYRAGGLTLADFYRLTVRRALEFIQSLDARWTPAHAAEPASLALEDSVVRQVKLFRLSPVE